MILVDTGPLVALCDSRDRLHRSAVRDLGRLSRQGLTTCGPVLTEACFHLVGPAGRGRLRRLLVDFAVGLIHGDDELGLSLEVFEWLSRYAEHDPDWTDGYLCVLTNRQRNLRLWTYDREFSTTWRRLDGTVVPLATS